MKIGPVDPETTGQDVGPLKMVETLAGITRAKVTEGEGKGKLGKRVHSKSLDGSREPIVP